MAQAQRDVRIQLGLCAAGLLEVEDVEEPAGEHLAHDFHRRAFRPAGEGHRERRQDLHALRLQQRQVPRHRRPPVMAKHRHALMPQRVHGALDVRAERQHVVGVHLLRRAALAVTTHLRDEHPVAGSGEGAHLVLPGMPALGKTVQHPHRFAVRRAAAVKAELDAVDRQQLVFEVVHGTRSRKV